jgi:RHS repeat-associated protein
LQGQYDYDAWGNSVVVKGKMQVDFGYTGLYFHQPSGLNLALYRAYSPTLGRWISRDPIGEEGGFNLYRYVKNSPISAIDPLGLLTFHYWPPEGGGGSKNGWYGHVSITLDDGTYISYWPDRPINPPFDGTNPRSPDYGKDKEGEGGRDPCDTKINGLDEKKIKEWWEKGNHGNFCLTNNCSDIVSEALRQGGLDIPHHLIYQPQNVKSDVGDALNP